MARINIEDSIYRTDSFLQLVINVGDKNKALGILVSSWTLAQRYYLDETNDRLVPLNARTTEIDELLKVGLAVQKGNKGFYLKGSDEQFGWLLQKSMAGKKSAEKKRQNKAKLLKTKKKASVLPRTAPLHERSTDVVPPTPTPTPTPSPSPAQTPALAQKRVTKRSDQTAQKLNSGVWEAYKSSYVKKYRVEPVQNAKVNAQVSQLAKRLGPEAIEVVKFYLDHPKAFYVSKMHEFGICLADAEALRTQWARGRAVTENDLKRYSKNQEQQQLLDAIDRGEV